PITPPPRPRRRRHCASANRRATRSSTRSSTPPTPPSATCCSTWTKRSRGSDMDPIQARQAHLTRRQFFGRGALGLGTAALATLLPRDLAGAAQTQPARFGGLPGLPHFAAKAKRVIYLFQNGAPTHVDLFDYKPGMEAWRGREIPAEIRGNRRLSTMTSGQGSKPVLPPITRFARHGQSGAWICDFLPQMASIADELCFIKSMHTEAVNHAPAITFLLTGSEQAGRPSMGAWLTYGLGSDTQDLPAFVVMTSRDREASCGQ